MTRVYWGDFFWWEDWENFGLVTAPIDMTTPLFMEVPTNNWNLQSPQFQQPCCKIVFYSQAPAFTSSTPWSIGVLFYDFRIIINIVDVHASLVIIIVTVFFFLWIHSINKFLEPFFNCWRLLDGNLTSRKLIHMFCRCFGHVLWSRYFSEHFIFTIFFFQGRFNYLLVYLSWSDIG